VCELFSHFLEEQCSSFICIRHAYIISHFEVKRILTCIQLKNREGVLTA
jgi:hypothetical protein